MSIDRRAHPRHEAEVSILFRGDGTRATTRDVSRGGCAILAPRMRLVNERLALTLLHPSTPEPLEVNADVKRSVGMPDGKWLLGVQFVEMDDALQKKVVAFVDSLASSRAAAPPPPPQEDPVLAKILRRSIEAEREGRLGDAIAILDEAIENAPKRADILASRARLSAATGDLRSAAQMAKRAVDLDPTNATYSQLYQRVTAKQSDRALAPGQSPIAGIFPPGASPLDSPKEKPPLVESLKDPRVLGILGAAAVVFWILLRWLI